MAVVVLLPLRDRSRGIAGVAVAAVAEVAEVTNMDDELVMSLSMNNDYAMLMKVSTARKRLCLSLHCVKMLVEFNGWGQSEFSYGFNAY